MQYTTICIINIFSLSFYFLFMVIFEVLMFQILMLLNL